MFLEKIEIQGFKSFVNKTVIEFSNNKIQKNITAIVGPNGSGKSNIADAIRWVLGEQSLKAIRCKKSDDIIFSGSEQKGRVSSAEVTIYLNNEKKIAPIDYSEVIITRRTYRDGETEYLINGSKVRLFDILLLLAKSNVGTKSFSIVGQGMIDNVITATPLDRRNFFDEAVGIKQFQIKRNQSLNKLEKSEQNLKQSEQLLKEIEPHLKLLTRQVEKLQKKEKLSKQLFEFQNIYYARIWHNLKNNISIKHEEQRHQTEARKVVEEKQNEIKNKLLQIETEDSRNEIFNKLQFDLEQLNHNRNTLLRDLTVLKGKMDIEFEKKGKLNLVWLHKQQEEITQKTKEFTLENKDLAIKLNAKKENLIDIEEQLKEINNKILNNENTIIHLKNEIDTKISSGPIDIIAKELKEISHLQNKFIKKITKVKSLDEFDIIKKEAQYIQDIIKELQNKIADNELELQAQKNIELSESDKIIEFQSQLKYFVKNKEEFLNKAQEAKLEIRIIEEREKLINSEINKLNNEKEKVSSEIKVQSETKNKADQQKILQKEHTEISEKVQEIDLLIEEIKIKINKFNLEEEEKKQELFKLERKYQDIQNELNLHNNLLNKINIDLAKLETKLEDTETEIHYELNDLKIIKEFKDFSNPKYEKLNNEEIFAKINRLKYQLEQIGGIDPETMKEYEQTKERFEFLEQQIIDLKNAIESLEKIIIELDQKIKKQFDKAFTEINKGFDKFFKILFEGGKAKLTKIVKDEQTHQTVLPLIDSQDINIEEEIDNSKNNTKAAKFKQRLYRGIDIYACPPGKKLAGVEMLSGGERSLTAIALIAAIISFNPSPFVVMDEVDAALDEANSAKMAKILTNLVEQTQFVLITHNRTIMNVADLIYGVTMTKEGISKLLSVELAEINQHSARL